MAVFGLDLWTTLATKAPNAPKAGSTMTGALKSAVSAGSGKNEEDDGFQIVNEDGLFETDLTHAGEDVEVVNDEKNEILRKGKSPLKNLLSIRNDARATLEVSPATTGKREAETKAKAKNKAPQLTVDELDAVLKQEGEQEASEFQKWYSFRRYEWRPKPTESEDRLVEGDQVRIDLHPLSLSDVRFCDDSRRDAFPR